jgi:hypothetical protein
MNVGGKIVEVNEDVVAFPELDPAGHEAQRE